MSQDCDIKKDAPKSGRPILSLSSHLLSSRLYCRYWNRTNSAVRLADFTAGRELRPALKNFYFIDTLILFASGADVKDRLKKDTIFRACRQRAGSRSAAVWTAAPPAFL